MNDTSRRNRWSWTSRKALASKGFPQLETFCANSFEGVLRTPFDAHRSTPRRARRQRCLNATFARSSHAFAYLAGRPPAGSPQAMTERRIDRRTFLKGGLLASGLLAGGGAAIAELAKSGAA